MAHSDDTLTDGEKETSIGLYTCDARLYDPMVGKFISPDTIIHIV